MWSVSVIVTTHDRAESLRLSLASLEMQTVRPYEVVIADDGSAPEHLRAIEELIARSPLRVLYARQEHAGFRVAANRNNAVRQATGDYLFFTDGDAVLYPDVLERHLELAGPRHWVSGYGVRLTPGETARVTEQLVREGRLEEAWPGPEDPRVGKLLTAAAKFRRKLRRMWILRTERRMRRFQMIGMQASMPREAFERVNGFDEAFEGWGEEDLDLGLRLQLAGLRPRTVTDTSRALHLYHHAVPHSISNRRYYDRPRRGQFRCPNGLHKDPPPARPAARPAAEPAPPAETRSSIAHPPRFLFVHVNNRCNLRCQHCAIWKANDRGKERYMPWERQRAVLHEFAGLSPHGTVVICGGESLLDLDHYFAITTECARHGLRSLSVTNGTRIREPRMADRLLAEGPSELTVSLNSHIAEQHDATRGVPGAFRMAVDALGLLLDARERHPERQTPIYAMALVHDGNYRQLDPFYDFVLNDLGADKLKLNFLQPTFGQSGRDDFFARHHITDPEALEAVLRACNAKYALELNPAWIRQVVMYCRSVHDNRNAHKGWHGRAGTQEHICNAYERNVVVDLYGTAGLCFSTSFPRFRLSEYGDLRYFWYDYAEPIRNAMRHCNRYCGISHSVRREPATLASARAIAAAARS